MSKGSGTAFDKVCVLLFAIFMSVLFCFAVCGSSGTAAEDAGETLSDTDDVDVCDFRDPETGVHYIIYIGSRRGGITVRYNADGTLFVD